jgi:pimeloyl-ACP methyl ester carboxylesterase
MTPPVVLLHAFPLSSAMWKAQRDGLASSTEGEISVFTPDLPGFGSAIAPSDDPDLGWMADSVMHFLDQHGLRSAVLGGLSMGGYVTMEILRRRPSVVSALVLADTKASADSPEGRQKRERMAATLEEEASPRVLVDEVLPVLLGETTKRRRPKLVELVRAEVERADPAAAAWAQRAMAARVDSFATLRATEVPALVVVGSEDALTPRTDAEVMADALPNGRLAVIEGSGHLSAVETPKEFNALVGGFVSSLS